MEADHSSHDFHLLNILLDVLYKCFAWLLNPVKCSCGFQKPKITCKSDSSVKLCVSSQKCFVNSSILSLAHLIPPTTCPTTWLMEGKECPSANKKRRHRENNSFLLKGCDEWVFNGGDFGMAPGHESGLKVPSKQFVFNLCIKV